MLIRGSAPQYETIVRGTMQIGFTSVPSNMAERLQALEFGEMEARMG